MSNARSIVSWGGTGRLGILKSWEDIEPEELQDTISKLKLKLDPWNADLHDLGAFESPRSGLSKICSVLVPGLPIYDSRVACALACRVRKYYGGEYPCEMLRFRIPRWRAPKASRCTEPGTHSATAYAQDIVKSAWLMNAILEKPGGSSPKLPKNIDSMRFNPHFL